MPLSTNGLAGVVITTTPSPRIGYGRHHEITLWRLMNEPCKRGRELKPPGRPTARASGLCEAQRLPVSSVGARSDLVNCNLFLKREVDGNVLNRLTGQCFAYDGPKLGGDHLPIFSRQRQQDIVGTCESCGQHQNAECYSYELSQPTPPTISVRGRDAGPRLSSAKGSIADAASLVDQFF